MVKNTKFGEKGLVANNGVSLRLIISIAEVFLFQCIFFYYNYYTRAQDPRKYFKYTCYEYDLDVFSITIPYIIKHIMYLPRNCRDCDFLCKLSLYYRK